jgi:hypothetical protein
MPVTGLMGEVAIFSARISLVSEEWVKLQSLVHVQHERDRLEGSPLAGSRSQPSPGVGNDFWVFQQIGMVSSSDHQHVG